MSAQAGWLVSGIARLDSGSPLITTDAAIGVDRTFTPFGFVPGQPGVAKWVDKSGGIPVGYPTVTMSVREPTKASRVYKVTVKLDLPTLEQTSPSTATGIQPAPTKAYSLQCIMEFLLPERSTLAERKVLLRNVASMFHSLINASDGTPTDGTNTPLIVAVESFEPVF